MITISTQTVVLNIGKHGKGQLTILFVIKGVNTEKKGMEIPFGGLEC